MTKSFREAVLTFEFRPVEIPRPKCHGLEFVPTRGRHGFYKSIRNEGHKYGLQIKSMGPRRPALPTANDFWNPPSSSPPLNNENQNPEMKRNGQIKKMDANANEILPPRYPIHQHNKTYYPIIEEAEFTEPAPDYDDQPSPVSKIPNAPPLPEFLQKRTIRL
ncbi:hypothetical protein M3Y97_00152000 [Aphelenchoides bicaudatus]|nr:hypothetical protein M3Y97_00152000 [Aphelenchoides bicaudatus]